MIDNIVEEIHAIREIIYKECGNDPEKLAAYYLKLQEESKKKPIASPDASHLMNSQTPLDQ